MTRPAGLPPIVMSKKVIGRLASDASDAGGTFDVSEDMMTGYCESSFELNRCIRDLLSRVLKWIRLIMPIYQVT